MIRVLFALALAAAAPAAAQAQSVAKVARPGDATATLTSLPDAPVQRTLIRGGRVITNTEQGVLERGDVLIEGGRIAAVGPSLSAPEGAAVIEAQGRWVSPGLFAAIGQLGLYDIAGSGAPNDGDASDADLGAAVDVARAFNPNSSAIAIARLRGITRAAIAPEGAGGIFAGQGALISLAEQGGGVFAPQAFQVLEIGEAGADHAGGSRAALWPMIEAALDDARGYPQRYQSGQGGAVLEEIDAKALKPYALGERLIVVRAEREADLRQLLALQRASARRPGQSGLKVLVHGGAEAWRLAPELAAAGMTVIVDPLANLPGSFEQLGARLDNPALLHAAGVNIIIGEPALPEDPPQSIFPAPLAGNAVANGLRWEAAFAAITSAPAAAFGLGDRLGALKPGMLADVVVWDGDPLEMMSAPVQVFIEGRAQPMRSRQTDLRDRYHPNRR